MKGCGVGIFWFTGLSGSGKTTLSSTAARRLRALGRQCLVLDGDELREGLCSDLGFSPEERQENMRRAGEMALLAASQGIICLCALIAPYQAMRNALRARLSPNYNEIHVDCPLEECIRRDPKLLYKRAHSGAITNYTGVGSPYEPPQRPELRVNTLESDIDASVELVMRHILSV